MNNIRINLMPKISVITVSYNAAETIETTILSVIRQTYENIEYIIIDGGSTDGTVDIIKKYQDKLAYWVSEPDKGIYDAMNKGIGYAQGDYIGIINSDDWYEIEAVQCLVEQIEGDSDVIHGNIICEKAVPQLIKPPHNLSSLKNHMTIFHPSVFVKRDVYLKYGTFDTKYRIAADWDLMLRFFENKCKFQYCDVTIAHFRMDGISSNFNLRQIKEKLKLRLAHRNYSILPLFKDLSIYSFSKVRCLEFFLKIKHICNLKSR